MRKLKNIILKEGGNLIADDGIKSFTVENLATRLFMSKKTIYQCFSTKEVLIKGIIVFKLKKQKESISVIRTFVKQTNTKDGCIFEINPKSSGQELAFYEVVSIEWKLNGSKDEILLRNTEELKKANSIINGISFVVDFTQIMVVNGIL